MPQAAPNKPAEKKSHKLINCIAQTSQQIEMNCSEQTLGISRKNILN